MLTVAQADLSAANGIRISFQVGRLLSAFDDLAADGLVGDPPDHPPRTSTLIGVKTPSAAVPAH